MSTRGLLAADGGGRWGTTAGGARRAGAGYGTRMLLVAAAAVPLLAAAGCGDDGGPAQSTASPDPALSAPAAVPSVDPEHMPVLDVYQGFVQSAAEAFNRGDPDYPTLAEHADGPALVRTRAAIEQHATNGRIYQGSPELVTVEVTHFDLDAPPEEPNAEVLACVDITDYVLVHEDDGSAVPVDRGLQRYQATAELWHTDDGRWLVVDFEELPETPC